MKLHIITLAILMLIVTSLSAQDLTPKATPEAKKYTIQLLLPCWQRTRNQ